MVIFKTIKYLKIAKLYSNKIPIHLNNSGFKLKHIILKNNLLLFTLYLLLGCNKESEPSLYNTQELKGEWKLVSHYMDDIEYPIFLMENSPTNPNTTMAFDYEGKTSFPIADTIFNNQPYPEGIIAEMHLKFIIEYPDIYIEKQYPLSNLLLRTYLPSKVIDGSTIQVMYKDVNYTNTIFKDIYKRL